MSLATASRSRNISSTQFIVGNTYGRINNSVAPTSRRNRNIRKVHEVTVYVDVLSDEYPSLIDRVTFDCGATFEPQVYVHSTPVPVHRPNGRKAWRFATRQVVYGRFETKIRIRGTGGTLVDTTHEVKFEDTSRKSATFTDSAVSSPIRPIRLPKDATFGIELEMSSSPYNTPDEIVDRLNQQPGGGGGGGGGGQVPIVNINSWAAGRDTTNCWKLVPDSSIVCSTTMPDCNRFELVSRVLKSGEGLAETSKILSKLKRHVDLIKVNKSMGFHVHIDVTRYSHAQLIKICQQFVKYEAAMDTILPPSRRSNSEESDKYFRSNRAAIEQSLGDGGVQSTSIWDVHNRIGMCGNIQELVHVMNPDGRYYKLNLTNLTDGRQPTIEFRQHSSTTSYEKVGSWARFCFWFCEHSAKLVPPKPFKRGRSNEYQLNALFTYVIKDRALRDFYMERARVLAIRDHDDDGDDDGQGDCCCEECAISNNSRGRIGGGSAGTSSIRNQKRGRIGGGASNKKRRQA